MVSKFDSLSARPPTPPKELEDSDKDINEALEFLHDPFGTKPTLPSVAATRSLLNTPEQSPSSDASPRSSSARRKKQVNFELQTCTIPVNGPAAPSQAPAHSSPLRPLDQTRLSRPLKSILKSSGPSSISSPANDGSSTVEHKTFAEMLESIMKQLASSARPSKLDGYSCLQRAMVAYEQVPDQKAMARKMGLLTQFIRRDVEAVGISGSGFDSQLVPQALKLLMALIRLPELRAAMDHDFCSFIVDRSILIAANANAPKAVVKHYLALLMQQNFQPTVMTPARTEKILDVLDTIHERVSGFSILAYRIRIYRKLIQQRPDVMARHTERWFKHTVKALLSNQKDINQGALDLAMSAAKIIGDISHVAKAVLNVLNRVKSDGDTLAKVMAKQMEKMLEGGHAVVVPQIWSAVTSLLRNHLQRSLFPAMADWLKVINKCLASGKEAVRINASVALCFLIYSVNISKSTEDGWLKMFGQIQRHQLQSCISTKKPERDVATSGYLTLLYYSLRPTASPEELDKFWDEFVADFWDSLVHLSPNNAIVACRVVSALLAGSRKPWNEKRALELKSQCMIQREDLPLLDRMWIRKSLLRIVKLIETLLDATPWNPNEWDNDPAKTMWLSLLDSLVEASSQEVMASSDTKVALAHIINMLKRMWDRHTAHLANSQQTEDNWADKYCFLIQTVVQKLGASQFADKCLTRNGNNEITTPSHRGRQNSSRISPLLYFIDLIVNQSEEKLPDSVRSKAMNLMIKPCLNAQNTRLSKLELLRDCSTGVDGVSSSSVSLNFWTEIAMLTSSCIRTQASDSNERVARNLGREYELVVAILALGSSYFLGERHGQEVLSSLISTVRREAGECAVVFAVTERVSEAIFNQVSEEDKVTCLPLASILLQNLPKNPTRPNLEQARQSLWPSSSTTRITDSDPYNYFYGALVSMSLTAYGDLPGDHMGIGTIVDFIAAFATSIRQCRPSLLAVYLRKTQDVVRLWVENPDRKLYSKDQPTKSLHQQVVNLWKDVCGAIETLPRKDSDMLLHLEPIISAGFLSRRYAVVNQTIATWNTTFGKEKNLEYPARVERAVRRVAPRFDLSLPSLDLSEIDMSNEASFYESDDSIKEPIRQLNSPRITESSPYRITKAARQVRSPAVSSGDSRRTTARQNAKIRLRHDNSQIHFEPITSSPTNPFNQESQILTDRQKEMVERQMGNANLFANMGSTISRDDALDSDVMNGDEMMIPNSRTPVKTTALVDFTDDYLGSSPTPSARSRSQHVLSDGTDVATPTAVRTVRMADGGEALGSSPPRLEKESELTSANTTSNDANISVTGDSFECRQPDLSFDEGTTVDEGLVSIVDETEPKKELTDVELPTGANVGEVPSSALELELTAQFDAEMEAANKSPQEASGSSNTFVDAASHPQSGELDNADAGNHTEVDGSLPLPPPAETGENAQAVSSSTTRIDNSFLSEPAEQTTPRVHSLRRSSRHSTTPSPRPVSGRKRKSGMSSASSKAKKTKVEDTPMQLSPQIYQSDDDGMLDNIVVAPPASRMTRNKTTRSSQVSSDSQVVIPETTRERSKRRSASQLSQVETHHDGLVEDTPTPKRARQSKNQDVGGAKATGHVSKSQNSQTKRLSHVRISPRRSSELTSVRQSCVAGDNETTPVGQTAIEEPRNDSTGDKKANVTPQPPDDATTTGATEQGLSQQAAAGISTPSRSFAERVILTPRSIINQLRNLKDYLSNCSQLMLGRAEEREIDDALFDIRRHVHAAGRRSEEQQGQQEQME